MDTSVNHEYDQLTDDQRKAVDKVLCSTPIIALTSTKVSTFADVLTNLISVSEFLKKVMVENGELRDDARRIDADFKAAGRILGRMGLTS